MKDADNSWKSRVASAMTGRKKLKALAACKKQKTKLVIGSHRACAATPPLGAVEEHSS